MNAFHGQRDSVDAPTALEAVSSPPWRGVGAVVVVVATGLGAHVDREIRQRVAVRFDDETIRRHGARIVWCDQKSRQDRAHRRRPAVEKLNTVRRGQVDFTRRAVICERELDVVLDATRDNVASAKHDGLPSL